MFCNTMLIYSKLIKLVLNTLICSKLIASSRTPSRAGLRGAHLVSQTAYNLLGLQGPASHAATSDYIVADTIIISYVLFNYNNIHIHSKSWNYRGCWHQTCPLMATS